MLDENPIVTEAKRVMASAAAHGWLTYPVKETVANGEAHGWLTYPVKDNSIRDYARIKKAREVHRDAMRRFRQRLYDQGLTSFGTPRKRKHEPLGKETVKQRNRDRMRRVRAEKRAKQNEMQTR